MDLSIPKLIEEMDPKAQEAAQKARTRAENARKRAEAYAELQATRNIAAKKAQSGSRVLMVSMLQVASSIAFSAITFKLDQYVKVGALNVTCASELLVV